MKKTILSVAVFAVMASTSAAAHKLPTSYDLKQDTQINDVSTRADSAQNSANAAYALANTKYTEGAGKNLERTVAGHYDELKAESATRAAADVALTAAVNGKVSQQDFKADQQRQDNITNSIGGQVTILNGQMKGVNQTVAQNKADQVVRDAGQDEHINAVQGAAQSANEKADGLAVRADGIETNLGNVQTAAQIANEKADGLAVRADGADKAHAVTDARSINNAVRLDGVEGGVATNSQQIIADREATKVRIEQEQSTRATADRFITDRVRKEEVNRANADAGLSVRIDSKVENSVFQERNTVVDNRFADTQQRIDTNKAEQAKVNKAVAGTLSDHENRLSAVEQNSNKKFANLGKRIDDVEDNANAGTAAAFAQANIPQVMAGGEFGVGAGVGSYSGESAIAVGASYAPTDRLVLKATVSNDSQHNFGAGAGVMVSFR